MRDCEFSFDIVPRNRRGVNRNILLNEALDARACVDAHTNTLDYKKKEKNEEEEEMF